VTRNDSTRTNAKGDVPHALTFFLTSAQRAAVLRALKRRDKDRATALLKALRIDGVKGGAQ
jgi:hypothetical protein